MPFAATWMDLEIIVLSEVSQTEKDKLSYDITYMWNLKKWYKWTYLQNRNRLTDLENESMVSESYLLTNSSDEMYVTLKYENHQDNLPI